MPLDNSIEFLPLKIAVLTVSDTRSLADDTSGQILVDRLTKAGHILADRAIVRDEKPDLTAQLTKWIQDQEVQVIISTGGTGLTGRDITPEVFHSLYDKEIEGFGEMFRLISYKIIGTSTLQSRATGGVAGGTYMFALPGSNGACKDGWDNILSEQLDIRFRPCNFAEMMPRLIE
ncbi:molybdenum cofactor biosynthesis protein B [Paremcibacter congregatus]|uniref:Molybdenum cofactor biosynthesis protein B n=1 Tax=Paremcibacter congregatus TaxID=2043170 RepID=A0A2G4YUE9_9PROT|nr:molybdenum cofactor biosynthesis protein B [Paremcibacter congregatus]PHZ85913.1 molybdenum cofactor biosynthesis protein B [Paremcibacter congregatus]QDE26879.1 molybdenum cofactor biosynthesis protein B [Paremcibacter congregatus]